MEQLSSAAAIALAAEGALLLDVRELDEWEAGHAADAIHMPMSTLAGRVDEVPTDRTIVCVCRSGARSLQVARALEHRGLVAHNLAGGMQAWEADGHEIITDGGAPGWVA